MLFHKNHDYSSTHGEHNSGYSSNKMHMTVLHEGATQFFSFLVAMCHGGFQK